MVNEYEVLPIGWRKKDLWMVRRLEQHVRGGPHNMSSLVRAVVADWFELTGGVLPEDRGIIEPQEMPPEEEPLVEVAVPVEEPEPEEVPEPLTLPRIPITYTDVPVVVENGDEIDWDSI